MYSFHCKHPSREKAKALFNQAHTTSSPSSHGTQVGRWELEPTQPQSLQHWGSGELRGGMLCLKVMGTGTQLSPLCHAQRQCLGLLHVE